ncbi:LysR family transcriptional regulator [Acidovorax sp. SUPP2539]|uniref:LysR family transcriptional regulator n=1 Tax=Acidovorax sp. SUPP2539 TaxID=2920878 RepID=UPI0023DE24EE|nr:LysR family transcriptional regulator [Acidovorax sp. SUPP2539]GKS91547.1 LysR family transcriptional regulator [Acidovorax sp. SUPP2539]
MHFSPADIAYFLEVARRGHVGRAADAVGVTQPAVSKAIRRLEEAVGVALFERGAHGARLTAEGRLFLESARRFDAGHAELMRSASELRAQHAGLLRVGLTNAASDGPAVRVLSDMVRHRPGLRLSMAIGKSDALNTAVEQAELDVAVVPSYPGIAFSCDQLPVGEDTVRVAARAHHPLARRSALTLADLADCAWAMPSRQSAARRLVAQIFEQAGAPAPRVTLETDYMTEAAMGLIASTDLVGLVPASTLRAWQGRVEALPLPMLEVRRTLVLLTRPQAAWSPLMAAFRDLLQQHVRRPAVR